MKAQFRPKSFLLVLAASSLMALSFPGQAQEVSEMQTVGGTLRVLAPEDDVDTLTLNKKPIQYMEGKRAYDLSDDTVSLKSKYRIGENDVVLVKTACAGTSCNYSSLYLVTITPRKNVTVSAAMDADEEGNADVKVSGNTITVTTKTYEGRRSKTQSWLYTNGNVKKTK